MDSLARYSVETAIIGALARSGMPINGRDELNRTVDALLAELFCPLQIEATADFLEEKRKEYRNA